VTKEEAFKELTGLILELKDKTKFLDNPELAHEWKHRHVRLTNEMASLNSCDQLWLSEKYELWFKQAFGDPKKLKEYMTKMFGQDVPK
jgi:hypothetical protein